MKKKILSLTIFMSIVSVSFGQIKGDKEVLKTISGVENNTKDLVVEEADIATVKEETVQLEKLDLNPAVLYEHIRVEEIVEEKSAD